MKTPERRAWLAQQERWDMFCSFWLHLSRHIRLDDLDAKLREIGAKVGVYIAKPGSA